MADLDFVQVGELSKGIVSQSPPVIDALVGRSLRLSYEDGTAVALRFRDRHALEWESVESGRHAADYLAYNPRDELYFVDYVASARPATSVSLVFDLGTGCATAVVGVLPGEAEVQKGLWALAGEGCDLTAVRTEFRRAAVGRPFVTAKHLHSPTDEMVGKRVQYVYSATEAYEHIYLNERLYAWHCLAGVEKGLADVDRCHAFKLGDALYLFVWREKIVPTLGVVVADWRQRRSFGKLFGYESSDFGSLVNTPIASRSTLLNITSHPGIGPRQPAGPDL